MYRKILIIWLLALLIMPVLLHATDRLYIRDPQSWRYGIGTIEEATISIKPKGIFMEVGLYLTISSAGLTSISESADPAISRAHFLYRLAVTMGQTLARDPVSRPGMAGRNTNTQVIKKVPCGSRAPFYAEQ